MVRIKIKAEIMRYFLLSAFVLWYPLQFKGLGSKGIYTPELAGFTLLEANIWLQKQEIPILVVLLRPTKEFFCAKRIGVCLQVSH